MQNFDKTLTTGQFNANYPSSQQNLAERSTKVGAELNDIKQQEVSVNIQLQNARNNIQSTNRNINTLQGERNKIITLRDNYARLANSGKWYNRFIYQRTYGPAVGKMNDLLPPIEGRINTLNATIPGLNTELNRVNPLKQQLDAEEARVKNNMSVVKVEEVTLITQKEYYDNREKACKDAETLIERQKTLLKQYEAELVVLNTEHNNCIETYNRHCSNEAHNKLNKLIAKRDARGQLVKEKRTEYKNDCKGKIKDCAPLYSAFQQNLSTYKVENDKKNKLDEEYNTCIDPAKNKCKDLYKDANFKMSVTNTNIDMLKPSTSKSSEGFTQYGANDSADATHAKLVANYKSVQNDYTKLKQNIQELNNANNNDVGKTSRYATKKQLYDNAIYTNILLTALATSMLYYVFVEI